MTIAILIYIQSNKAKNKMRYRRSSTLSLLLILCQESAHKPKRFRTSIRRTRLDSSYRLKQRKVLKARSVAHGNPIF